MDRAELFVRLKRKDEASKDWDRMIELGEGQTSPHLRMYWAMASAHRGAHAQATAEVEALLAKGERPENALYNFACIFSLSSAAVLNDSRLSSHYGARSVELLEQCRKEGSLKMFINYLKDDSDLNPVRSRDDFMQVTRQLEEDIKAAPLGEGK